MPDDPVVELLARRRYERLYGSARVSWDDLRPASRRFFLRQAAADVAELSLSGFAVVPREPSSS